MRGRIAAVLLLVSAAVAGAALWYVQVYGQYRPIALGPDAISAEGTFREPETSGGFAPGLRVSNFEGISGRSSPLKYRSCFSVESGIDELAGAFERHPDPTPLVAPGWFRCFDATAIGRAIESGEAAALLLKRNVGDGVDRVAAILPDGRGFSWNQLNDLYKD